MPLPVECGAAPGTACKEAGSCFGGHEELNSVANKNDLGHGIFFPKSADEKSAHVTPGFQPGDFP